MFGLTLFEKYEKMFREMEELRKSSEQEIETIETTKVVLDDKKERIKKLLRKLP